jgi:hypothetical protein
MGKMKVYYYTEVNSDKPAEDVFDEYPEEITSEGPKGPITLIKDTIEAVSNEVEYGEG